MKAYLGIDVGGKGFITLRNPNGLFEFKSIDDSTPAELNMFLSSAKQQYGDDLFCAMEEVHAIFGSSAKATFAFGEINGLLKGLLIANRIPFSLVQPKIWQKEIWNNQDIVVEYKKVTVKGVEQTRKEVNTKQTSFNAAQRIFPEIDLRKTERCKKLDDNKCDSLLICEYARRKNL